jgi:hypothetical protein
MRIHSDTLTADDIEKAALQVADVSPIIEGPKRSRKRAQAFEVALRGHGKRHVRPPANGDVSMGYAATWHDWGWFLALVYDADPNAWIPYYGSVETFDAATKCQFADVIHLPNADDQRAVKANAPRLYDYEVIKGGPK